MEVKLHDDLQNNLLAVEAAGAIEACVHCGFCLATCPTYLDSRDERDSPRGRIYLVKEYLETGVSKTAAQFHLDRCLTCRSCETTCPSGVAYGEIADSGRALIEQEVPRPVLSRLQRWLLRRTVPHAKRIGALLTLGQWCRPLLPEKLREHVPPKQPLARTATAPIASTDRRVILLEGCVQSAATPATNGALRDILACLKIGIMETEKQGCCGALSTHLAAIEEGKEAMRRNIDAWWPAVTDGAEAILFSATGCGTQLTDYGRAFEHEPTYAERAKQISALAVDASVFLTRERVASLAAPTTGLPRIAVQIPCSQSHGLGDTTSVSQLLSSLGYAVARTRDEHLCCGSAGTYSLLQPAMSRRLRAAKLENLLIDEPDVIVSANIGCQLHLQAATSTPVKHWLELVADRVV